MTKKEKLAKIIRAITVPPCHPAYPDSSGYYIDERLT